MKWVLVVLLLLWSLGAVAEDLPEIGRALPRAWEYVLEMFPPDFSILPDLVEPLLETLQTAVLSILLASIVAVPLSFLAARDTTPNLALYGASNLLVGFLRTMPTLLWAILFVAMVGLGPLAGVFALTAHCVGALGKYFQEAIESTVPKIQDVIEAMRVDGATEPMIVRYGILPEVAPLFVSYVLYYFEWCVRVGTTLGLVGAGGLGLRLTQTIRLFKRKETSAIIIVILSLVLAIHLLSSLVRKELVRD